MIPASIEQISDQVICIKWDDGEEQIYFADETRGKCPCASCRDKEDEPKNPFIILKANPNNVVFTGWEMIGRYAVRFSFSDKHGTGIYTYEYLKKIGQKS